MKKFALFVGALAFTGVSSGWADSGMAILNSTGSQPVRGTVVLTDTPQGLKIDADVAGAPPGEHGFHIHEYGACGDQGKAAGGHYNPAGHPHGNALKDGIAKAHAGDFGSINIDKSGKGSLHVLVPGLALTSGPAPIAGHAFILHEKVDDMSQPTGNAGGRIACGPVFLIGTTVPAPAAAPAAPVKAKKS